MKLTVKNRIHIRYEITSKNVTRKFNRSIELNAADRTDNEIWRCEVRNAKDHENKMHDIEKQLPLVLSSREYLTALLGWNWFDVLKIELQTNQNAALETKDESPHGINNQLYANFCTLLHSFNPSR